MPRGNGTGPTGQGPAMPAGRPGTGRGRGQGIGGGKGMGGGNWPGAGPGGNCVCPKCGATVSHQLGTPCYTINCPKCGTKMARE